MHRRVEAIYKRVNGWLVARGCFCELQARCFRETMYANESESSPLEKPRPGFPSKTIFFALRFLNTNGTENRLRIGEESSSTNNGLIIRDGARSCVVYSLFSRPSRNAH